MAAKLRFLCEKKPFREAFVVLTSRNSSASVLLSLIFIVILQAVRTFSKTQS